MSRESQSSLLPDSELVLNLFTAVSKQLRKTWRVRETGWTGGAGAAARPLF